MNIRKELYANVVLPSGTIMFPKKFVECRTKKLTALASPTMMIMVGCSAREKALGGVNYQLILADVDLDGEVNYLAHQSKQHEEPRSR